MEDKFKGKVFFYEQPEYKITCPSKKEDPTIGVRWVRGMLTAEDFKSKVVNGTGNDQIQLDTFEDASAEDLEVDPHYYNSDLPLRGFVDAAAVDEDVSKFISGENLIPRIKKFRRKKPTSEVRKELKGDRYEENLKCMLCDRKVDKKRSQVLLTRCACPSKDGRVPSAWRFTWPAYRKKKITQLICKSCGKVIQLLTQNQDQSPEI